MSIIISATGREFAGALPIARELTVKAAPIGEAGEPVEARQFLKMLVGNAQFLLARGELLRHVVKRDSERLEFGEPGLIGCARTEITTAETCRGARQRPDRPHNKLLAAEPRDEKNEHAVQPKLQVGDTQLAIDAAVHDISSRPTASRACVHGTCT